MLCVPPNFITLVNSKLVPKHNLSSLRSVMVGAAPVSAELSLAFMRAIPSARVTGGYGMTETSPNICLMHRGQSSPERAKYVGRLLPIYQARLVREDGEDADGDAGEEGELWVRGPSVMKGYHNNPSATAATIAEGGWMKTGDVATRTPDGWYAIVDRKKELIKYKGFQVAPAELEGLLLEHERVLDAGVVSVYDAEQATELPRAYVVLNLEGKSPATIAQDVMAHVAKRASNHKRLRGGVVVVDAVPKSPSGKILRKLLRERAAKNSDDVHMPSSARL
jgi:acyl-CoA synthetase (AMP-forming)/AMP-acid ligase II